MATNPHDNINYNPATDPSSSVYKNAVQTTAVQNVNSAFVPTNEAQRQALANVNANFIPTTVTGANLKQENPISIASTPTPTNYGSVNAGAVASVGGVNGVIPQPVTTVNTTPQPKTLQQTLADITGLYKTAPSAEEAYQRTQQEAGIQEKQQAVKTYTNQINAITAKAQADILSVTGQGRGIPEAIIGGQQAQLQKEAAIATLPLTALLSAAQGDLATAQQHADTLFKIRYDDAIAGVNQYNKSVDLAYDIFTKAEQRQLDTNKAVLATRNSFVSDLNNNTQTLATEALKTGNSSIFQQLSGLSLPDPMSNTYEQDVVDYKNKVANYGSGIVDKNAILDTQYKQAQINKLNADAKAALQADATVTPDVLQGMLNVYKSTGVLPAFGLSAKSPLRAQFYAALGADGGIVTEANTNKTVRAGLTQAYKTQQNQLSANQTAISTLDQQLGLAQQYSDKVSRSDSPLVNKYVLDVKRNIFGDPDTAALHNIVTTASYELAKILSGSAASISGVTVSSAADATNLLNSAMSKGQFNEVLGLMKQEANFRLNSQKDTLTQLEKDLNNVGSLSTDLKDAPVINNTNTTKGQKSLINGHTYISDGTQWVLNE